MGARTTKDYLQNIDQRKAKYNLSIIVKLKQNPTMGKARTGNRTKIGQEHEAFGNSDHKMAHMRALKRNRARSTYARIFVFRKGLKDFSRKLGESRRSTKHAMLGFFWVRVCSRACLSWC